MNPFSLSRKTGIGQPVLRRLVIGDTTNPNIDTLRPIAKFFSISLSQLVGDEPLPLTRLPGTHTAGILATAYLPLLSWSSILDWLKNPEEIKPTLTEWISTEKQVSVRGFAITIETDSYGLMFKKGSLVILDPDKIPQDGDLVLIKLNSEPDILFKQVIKDGSDIYLRPVNTEINRVKLLDEPHQFVGTVIELRYDLEQATSQKAASVRSHVFSGQPILDAE